MFLLTIVTNEPNSFEIELILSWEKMNQFRFLRKFFLEIFVDLILVARVMLLYLN